LLFGVVEGDSLAGLDGRDVHAKRDRVAVAGVNVGVGGLATANALEQLRTFATVMSSAPVSAAVLAAMVI